MAGEKKSKTDVAARAGSKGCLLQLLREQDRGRSLCFP